METPILIIGAGVAGLALAQGLFKHDIPFRIFERDGSFHARTQGYRVRISEDGIEAMRCNLPRERFDTLESSCAKVTSASNAPSILDASTAQAGAPLFKPGQKPPSMQQTNTKPWSVDRSVLREVLTTDLSPFLEFGKGFQSFCEDGDGVRVTFTDGSTARGSLLVGADGTWSPVRQQLFPSYQLADSEGRLIYGKTPMAKELIEQFSPVAMSGLTLLRGPQDSCLLEPMRFNHADVSLPTPEDYVYWVLFARKEQWMSDDKLIRLGPEDIVALSRNLTKAWHGSLRPLFHQHGTIASVSRVLTSRPSALPTAAAPSGVHTAARATLIGDAAHPMPPTAALGATTALRDTAALVRHLLESINGQTGPAALRAYETEMNGYARAAVASSLPGGKAMFGMKDFDQLPVAV
ncbi:Uu.00g000090.m01.CDS01 [Anthostomella pinea]|uniref:Uu.00g000090.m01.CDS01 n=1 Tax=Anthostomella pinea TaxID=933095 RepID=A0AAI8YID4_9PEZI|nr:Uu.00g000090.m01.CDS01 [Anthostomella pinea]